jgi:hypothetical protein
MSVLGTERTYSITRRMSVSDPKRTLKQEIENAVSGVQLFERRASGDWFSVAGLLVMKATCNANRGGDDNRASEK